VGGVRSYQRIPTGFRHIAQGCDVGATLGEWNKIITNPDGVVANAPRSGRKRNGRNPECFRGWDVCETMTQGSSSLATLGLGTESRWDSHTTALPSKTGHEPVRAQLTDFFEYLAENHGLSSLSNSFRNSESFSLIGFQYCRQSPELPLGLKFKTMPSFKKFRSKFCPRITLFGA
jgi:hypothetical protein